MSSDGAALIVRPASNSAAGRRRPVRSRPVRAQPPVAGQLGGVKCRLRASRERRPHRRAGSESAESVPARNAAAVRRATTQSSREDQQRIARRMAPGPAPAIPSSARDATPWTRRPMNFNQRHNACYIAITALLSAGSVLGPRAGRRARADADGFLITPRTIMSRLRPSLLSGSAEFRAGSAGIRWWCAGRVEWAEAPATRARRNTGGLLQGHLPRRMRKMSRTT